MNLWTDPGSAEAFLALFRPEQLTCLNRYATSSIEGGAVTIQGFVEGVRRATSAEGERRPVTGTLIRWYMQIHRADAMAWAATQMEVR